MKRNILILVTVFCSVILSSCDDFLDKDPLDQISSGTFWQSKGDYEMALTACYGNLQNSMFSSGMPNWDVLTDNGYGQHNYWGTKDIVQGNISSTSGGYISSVFSSSYSAIARINVFLDKLEAYEGTEISADEKLAYQAEARFLRGFYYYYLYFCYGSVPVITEPLTLETQYQAKSGAADVLTQTLGDIDFAIANLPEENYFSGESGHAVKSSAQALKARLLLYTAYDNQGNPNTSTLAQVKALAEDIIGQGYELSDEYTDVFRDGTQEGNKEIIFSIKFLAPDEATSMDQWYGDWIVISPLQNLVDAYEMNDGQAIGDTGSGYDSENQFSNRDPRLAKTIFDDYVDFGDGKVHNPSNGRPTGYGVAKFLSPDLMPYGYSTQSQQDWVMFRLGEVLLMLAEAQNEIEGADETVYNAINAVRNRVNMPSIPAGLSKEQMRERIRKERRIELAFEGLRYYDLKRWRVAGDVLNNVSDGIISYHFEDKFYLWPIPESEIEKNQGKLEQNPDYL